MSHVLVLNADSMPLSIFPLSTENWSTTIKNVWLGTVSTVTEYEDWIVRSPSIEVNVPAIVRLRDYVKTSKTVKFSRDNVFLRDNYTCQYCSADFSDKPNKLTFEHLKPRFFGGKTNFENILTACPSCNLERGHKLNYKAPLTQPKKPSYWDLVKARKQKPIVVPHVSWIEYLDWNADVIVEKLDYDKIVD
jgi:5-methylcytosine-specific restriction endonuclease McrA